MYERFVLTFMSKNIRQVFVLRTKRVGSHHEANKCENLLDFYDLSMMTPTNCQVVDSTTSILSFPRSRRIDDGKTRP